MIAPDVAPGGASVEGEPLIALFDFALLGRMGPTILLSVGRVETSWRRDRLDSVEWIDVSSGHKSCGGRIVLTSGNGRGRDEGRSGRTGLDGYKDALRNNLAGADGTPKTVEGDVDGANNVEGGITRKGRKGRSDTLVVKHWQLWQCFREAHRRCPIQSMMWLRQRSDRNR